MEEIEILTELIGTPQKTADELGINIRSYFNYKAGKIPKYMEKLISLKIEEHRRIKEAANQ